MLVNPAAGSDVSQHQLPCMAVPEIVPYQGIGQPPVSHILACLIMSALGIRSDASIFAEVRLRSPRVYSGDCRMMGAPHHIRPVHATKGVRGEDDACSIFS
jgi:hypothetical protein